MFIISSTAFGVTIVNAATTIQLANNYDEDYDPKIDGGYVVWSAVRDTPPALLFSPRYAPDHRRKSQTISENFETYDLLTSVDQLDNVRGILADGDHFEPPEIRRTLLKLHRLAMGRGE